VRVEEQQGPKVGLQPHGGVVQDVCQALACEQGYRWPVICFLDGVGQWMLGGRKSDRVEPLFLYSLCESDAASPSLASSELVRLVYRKTEVSSLANQVFFSFEPMKIDLIGSSLQVQPCPTLPSLAL
jgi:hypothetical protein